MNAEIYLMSRGAGKTTKLVEMTKEYLNMGYKVAFISINRTCVDYMLRMLKIFEVDYKDIKTQKILLLSSKNIEKLLGHHMDVIMLDDFDKYTIQFLNGLQPKHIILTGDITNLMQFDITDNLLDKFNNLNDAYDRLTETYSIVSQTNKRLFRVCHDREIENIKYQNCISKLKHINRGLEYDYEYIYKKLHKQKRLIKWEILLIYIIIIIGGLTWLTMMS